MLIAAKNMFEISKLKTQLSGEFEIKDLGATKKILGMEIPRDKKEEKLYLFQNNYFDKVLECFEMHDSKIVGISLVNHFKIFKDLSLQTEEEKKYMSHVSYASTVGSLMHVLESYMKVNLSFFIRMDSNLEVSI